MEMINQMLRHVSIAIESGEISQNIFYILVLHEKVLLFLLCRNNVT